MTKILGKKPSSNLKMKDYGTFKSYSTGKNAKVEDMPMAKTLLQGKIIVGEEIAFTDQEKNKKALLINASPIKDNKGKIIAGVSTIQDITVQKDLERQKDDLIAAASHELKTPLTSLVVYGQLLEKKISAKKERESLDILKQMNSQFQSFTKLINELLDVNQLGRGRMQLHEEAFLIRKLAKEITNPLLQISDTEIVIDIPKNLKVFADKQRIRQVLTNLLTNAVKFSTKNKKIIIKAQDINKSIIVSVQDFGIGIDAEYKSKVFERFFRASNNRSYPGLGLGLYLSGEIIKQHHQKIWVESEKGKGSTFNFSLQKTK
jgi:signal transduction histidine kinase